MPPLKECRFQNQGNILIIQAYSFEHAYEQLVQLTKNPSDWLYI